jgi:hypothetical protein
MRHWRAFRSIKLIFVLFIERLIAKGAPVRKALIVRRDFALPGPIGGASDSLPSLKKAFRLAPSTEVPT